MPPPLISLSRYALGVSNWNFNLEDLKAQAALLEDSEITKSAAGEAPKVQHKGRFDVYEEEEAGAE